MALEYRIDEKVLLNELVQKRKESSWRYHSCDTTTVLLAESSADHCDDLLLFHSHS